MTTAGKVEFDPGGAIQQITLNQHDPIAPEMVLGLAPLLMSLHISVILGQTSERGDSAAKTFADLLSTTT